MADYTKAGSTYTPLAPGAFVAGAPSPANMPDECHRVMGIAGATIAAGDACYVKTSDGLVYPCPTALNTPYHGIALSKANTGHPVTLAHGFVCAYLSTAANINDSLYLSASVAGALGDTAAGSGIKVGWVVPLPGGSGSTSKYVYFPSSAVTNDAGSPAAQFVTITDTLTFSGATGVPEIQLTDNLADALSIAQSTNDYLVFKTTNSAEEIQVKQTLAFPNATGNNNIDLTDNLADALSIRIPSGNDLMSFTTTNSAEAVTMPAAFAQGSDATDRVTIKGMYMSPANVAVTVPAITDPDIAKVDVDVSSAFSMQPAVGDAVIAIPAEAMEANARILGCYVTATDQVTLVFGSEGGNVTGGSKNFKFMVFDLT